MKKIIHYCWFGGKPLSDTAKKSLASWEKYALGFELKQWNESNFDYRTCKWSRNAYEAGLWAFVADYARFKVLYEYGGVYMDVGSELIKDISPLMKNVPFTAIEEQSLTATTGLVVAVEPYNPLIGACVSKYESMDFINDPGFLDANTVNEIFTSELENIGFKRIDKEQRFGGWLVLDSKAFNPVYGLGGYHIKPGTYSIHRSSGSWVEPKYRIKRTVVRKCSPFIGRRLSQILGRVLMEVGDDGLVGGWKKVLEIAHRKITKGKAR